MNNSVRAAMLPSVLTVLLIAVFLPWLVVNSGERFEFTVLDAIRGLTSSHGSDPSNFRIGDFASFISIYKDTYLAFAFGVIFYAISIAFVVFGAAFKERRKAALGPSGVSAIASVMAWIFGIESLKSHILSDGQLGSAYSGQISGFLDSAVTPGFGPLIVLAAGIMALAYYFIKEQPEKSSDFEAKVEGTIADEDEEIPKETIPSSNSASESREPRLEERTRPESVNIVRIVYKSSGTAALLAFIGAIFGFLGIGHIYVGRVGRGFLILISGFVLYAFMWLSIFGGIFGGIFGAVMGGSNASVPALQTGFGLAGVLGLLYFGLLIWQILDARSLAKKVNEHVMLTGKEPW